MRRRAWCVGAIVVGALTMGGCTTEGAEIRSDVASLLQTSVLISAQHAAAGDPAAALSEIRNLLARLDAAVASGQVSPDKAEHIRASAERVRLSLQAAADALQGSTTDSAGTDSSGDVSGTQESEPPTEQSVDDDVSAPPADETPNSGNGNSGGGPPEHANPGNGASNGGGPGERPNQGNGRK